MIEHVFFVDDDFPTNFYHEIIGKKSGVVKKMTSFLSSKEALNYFERIHNGEPLMVPQVLFLDLNMPELNGWDFLDSFRDLKLETKPAIYVLSTTITATDKKRFSDDILVEEALQKPLTEEVLKSILIKCDAMT